MMVGRGLVGLGLCLGLGLWWCRVGVYWGGDAGQVVTTFFRVWVLRWCSFWFLEIEA